MQTGDMVTADMVSVREDMFSALCFKFWTLQLMQYDEEQIPFVVVDPNRNRYLAAAIQNDFL